MLNLSPQRVLENLSELGLKSIDRINLPTGQVMFRRWVFSALAVGIILLFLPWIQNFRAKGKVTALNPASRPQTVQSSIPGRVEAWFVMEGDTVLKGDTIARLSEIKPEYLDPELVSRTGRTRDAKSSSADGYLAKSKALANQAATTRQERDLTLRKTKNKLEQSRLYVSTLAADLAQQETQVEIANYQLARADSLYRRGLKPLTDQEAKRLKAREASAKLTALRNKVDQAKTDVKQAELAIQTVEPEYNGKLAKIESDRQSAMTAYYTSIGEVEKLNSQEANYRIRQDFEHILAPQDGIIAKVLKPGIGETVKEGDEVVSILPSTFIPAVEMFVDPFNLPLVKVGEEVRFLFDGWPAIVFSGWPGLSYGTFVGEIAAVDNIIDDKGRYRVLVKPSKETNLWPEALRPGSGAEGVVLLNRVSVWYELWRQLNAFPPDYYDPKGEQGKDVKMKAPAKVLAK
ncbi:MAG: HlyD family secretion protein [Saprospiraceae bacterium]